MQIVRLATPVLWLSPDFTTSEFPIFNLLQLLKFLLEVVAIGRKKCREGSRHSPSYNRYGFANHCILSCALLHCHAYPWGGGNFCREGRGGLKPWNDDVGMMMRWIAFYILFTKEFSESLRGTHLTFCFALLWDLCSTPSIFVRILHLTSCIFFFGQCNKLKKSFGRLENFWQENFWRFLKMFAPNLCAWWKNRRKMFAPNLCAWWKNRRKMFAPNLCAWWENRRKMFALYKTKIGQIG